MERPTTQVAVAVEGIVKIMKPVLDPAFAVAPLLGLSEKSLRYLNRQDLARAELDRLPGGLAHPAACVQHPSPAPNCFGDQLSEEQFATFGVGSPKDVGNALIPGVRLLEDAALVVRPRSESILAAPALVSASIFARC
jgi:hypothetical protein